METLFRKLIKARTLTAALLLLLLAAGQWALLEHSFDLAAHDQGEVCELCVQLASAKFVSVAGSSPYLSSPPPAWMPSPPATSTHSPIALYQAARGPPARLLS